MRPAGRPQAHLGQADRRMHDRRQAAARAEQGRLREGRSSKPPRRKTRRPSASGSGVSAKPSAPPTRSRSGAIATCSSAFPTRRRTARRARRRSTTSPARCATRRRGSSCCSRSASPCWTRLEFYRLRKPLPHKLKLALDANDASLEAQRSLVQNQQTEVVRINALYDAELARLKKLWAGALPGSRRSARRRARRHDRSSPAPSSRPRRRQVGGRLSRRAWRAAARSAAPDRPCPGSPSSPGRPGR